MAEEQDSLDAYIATGDLIAIGLRMADSAEERRTIAATLRATIVETARAWLPAEMESAIQRVADAILDYAQAKAAGQPVRDAVDNIGKTRGTA